MNISSILKLKAQAERDAVLSLQRAIKAVKDGSVETFNDVVSGAERASWYSSCLFEKYNDVCSELKTEDKRFFNSIYEIYKRQDVIYDIVKMYFDNELSKLSDDQIRMLDRSLTKILATYQTGKASKLLMAGALSVAVTKSFGFSNRVLFSINKTSLSVITVLGLYSKMQASALSARNLRVIYPEFYWILHQNNLESLYFLVSEKMDESIIKSIGLSREERLTSIIKTLTN